jgi:glycosyltransferase involved in cell wall biosynthesis
LKIVFATDGIFPHMVGGMQRHSRLLAEALARIPGNELIIIHPHEGERIFPDFPNITEVALPPLPGRQYYVIELYLYSLQVLKVIEQHPDAVVYSQGLSVWAGLWEHGKRVIINPHGLEPFQAMGTKEKLKSWPLKWAFKKVFPKAARVVSLGGRLTNILKELLPEERIAVLHNASNAPDLPVQSLVKQVVPPLRFLFVSRFVSNKGIPYLMEAVGLLHEAGWSDRFELHLVGKGPLFESSRAGCTSPNVHFLGFVPDEDLNQHYLSNHVFLLPTLFEGMPTVIIEAMAHGMPVIVTDTGATTELVDDSNGRIIEKANAQAIVEAVQQFCTLPAERLAAMSQASLSRFHERFSWPQVAQAHMLLFEEVLQKG